MNDVHHYRPVQEKKWDIRKGQRNNISVVIRAPYGAVQVKSAPRSLRKLTNKKPGMVIA